jgi:alpha-1,2-mannosyltransferase
MIKAAAMTTAQLPPVHPLPDFHYFDLKVYRQAAIVVGHGAPLYSTHLKHGLGFTYPPFALLLFLPLTWLPLHTAEADSVLANIALTALAVHAATRLARPCGPRGSAAAWLAAAAALWIEPISTTIGYGQVDLLIAVLVIADLAYLRGTRAAGIGIGLAAALKLTPLVFIPYLLFTGRGRAAARALGVVLLSILVAFVTLPRDAAAYWGGKFLDFSRVTGGHHHGAGSGATNQSLRGAVLRLFPTITDPRTIWLLASAIVVIAGLALAIRAAQRGDEALGFLLTAITGLLISPVSWTHHWAIAVPGALALLLSNRRALTGAVAATLALAFAVDGYAIWAAMIQRPVPLHLTLAQLLVRNLYVAGGLGMLAFVAAGELRRVAKSRTLPIPDLDAIITIASGQRPRRPRPRPRPVPDAQALMQAHARERARITQPHALTPQPALSQPQLAAASPGHPGAALRAVTASQPGSADRQSLR